MDGMCRQPGRPPPVREIPANGPDDPPLKAGESMPAPLCRPLREATSRRLCRTLRMAEASPYRVIRLLNTKDSRLEARVQAHHPQTTPPQSSRQLRPRRRRGAGQGLLLPRIPRAHPSPLLLAALPRPPRLHHPDPRQPRPLRHHRLHRHHLQALHHRLHHPQPPHQLRLLALPHQTPPLREPHHRPRLQPQRLPADRLLQGEDHREPPHPRAARSGAAPTVWRSRRSPACRHPCAMV